jgi:hypothetical protein
VEAAGSNGSFIRRRARFDFGSGGCAAGWGVDLLAKGEVEIHARIAAASPSTKAKPANP